MRYAERGWTTNGSQEKSSEEESNQEESNQEEVAFSKSREWDCRGHECPRRIFLSAIIQPVCRFYESF
jgi:hypothetical protein